MKNLTLQRVALIALCLLGLAGALAVRAADAPIDQSKCRDVTRQAAVWPKAAHPGKSNRVAKFETRQFIVCDVDRTKSR
jgi:hypothetical protein